MYDNPRSTVVIWVVAAAVAVFALVRLLGGGHETAPSVSVDGGAAGAAGDGSGATGSRSRASAATGSGGELYVHVAGAVRKPGLLRLPADTRVAIALERAGGPTRRADLTLVNLAAPLQDGQQIVVPVRGAASGSAAGTPAGAAAAAAAGAAATGAAATGAAAGATGAAAPGAKVHLSTATAEQLDAIDGIGPTLATRIVEYRDGHGGFRSLEELAEVEGIGEKRLATLRDALQP